jgi:predicted metal-binding membrane protein
MRTLVFDRGMRPVPATGPVPAAVPAAIGLAWAGLLVAELRGAPISHDALAGGSLPLAPALGIFSLAWVAMVVAMMLPSAYPAVRAFAAGFTGPGNRMARVAGFLAGYVAVWTVFGFALFLGDVGIHAVVDASPAPGAAHAVLTSDALIVAGAFQLTRRKLRCLSRCRQAAQPPEPAEVAGTSAGAGSGGAGATSASAGALRVGVAHGLQCLGACWGLMLAVFALASPEILWMAVFGAVMLYEKAGRHGLVAARAAGAALLAASVVVALS